MKKLKVFLKSFSSMATDLGFEAFTTVLPEKEAVRKASLSQLEIDKNRMVIISNKHTNKEICQKFEAEIKESIEKDNYTYGQGDLDGRSLSSTYISSYIARSSMMTEATNPDGLTDCITIAYVDDAGVSSGVAINYLRATSVSEDSQTLLEDSKVFFMISIMKNTTAPFDERQVLLISSEEILTPALQQAAGDMDVDQIQARLTPALNSELVVHLIKDIFKEGALSMDAFNTLKDRLMCLDNLDSKDLKKETFLSLLDFMDEQNKSDKSESLTAYISQVRMEASSTTDYFDFFEENSFNKSLYLLLNQSTGTDFYYEVLKRIHLLKLEVLIAKASTPLQAEAYSIMHDQLLAKEANENEIESFESVCDKALEIRAKLEAQSKINSLNEKIANQQETITSSIQQSVLSSLAELKNTMQQIVNGSPRIEQLNQIITVLDNGQLVDLSAWNKETIVEVAKKASELGLADTLAKIEVILPKLHLDIALDSWEKRLSIFEEYTNNSQIIKAAVVVRDSRIMIELLRGLEVKDDNLSSIVVSLTKALDNPENFNEQSYFTQVGSVHEKASSDEKVLFKVLQDFETNMFITLALEVTLIKLLKNIDIKKPAANSRLALYEETLKGITSQVQANDLNKYSAVDLEMLKKLERACSPIIISGQFDPTMGKKLVNLVSQYRSSSLSTRVEDFTKALLEKENLALLVNIQDKIRLNKINPELQKATNSLIHTLSLVQDKKPVTSKELLTTHELLVCVSKGLDKPADADNLNKLESLLTTVSGHTSLKWQKVSICLLVFASALLMVAGLALAIPSFGSSLSLTVGGAAMASTVITASLATGSSLALGAGTLFEQNREKGLAQSVSFFKAALQAPNENGGRDLEHLSSDFNPTPL